MDPRLGNVRRMGRTSCFPHPRSTHRMAETWTRTIPATQIHWPNTAIPDMGQANFRTRSALTHVHIPFRLPNPMSTWRPKLFQSKQVDSNYSLPPIVHAYHGNKVNLGRKLAERQEEGLAPLSAALLGIQQLPPLWTHSNGCDFVRGGRFVVKPRVPASRTLTSSQVLLLRSLWLPVPTPHQHNTQPPWTPTCVPVRTLCGQHASLQLPAEVAQPLRLALQQRLQFAPGSTELYQ